MHGEGRGPVHPNISRDRGTQQTPSASSMKSLTHTPPRLTSSLPPSPPPAPRRPQRYYDSSIIDCLSFINRSEPLGPRSCDKAPATPPVSYLASAQCSAVPRPLDKSHTRTPEVSSLSPRSWRVTHNARITEQQKTYRFLPKQLPAMSEEKMLSHSISGEGCQWRPQRDSTTQIISNCFLVIVTQISHHRNMTNLDPNWICSPTLSPRFSRTEQRREEKKSIDRQDHIFSF